MVDLTNLNYTTPHVPTGWAASRETHDAVAMAIHAISSDERTPQAIFENPTDVEYDTVQSAVAGYTQAGIFDAVPQGQYDWGEGMIVIATAEK